MKVSSVSLARRSQVFEHASIGILVTDPDTCVIVDANAHAGAMFDQDPATLSGTPLEDLWNADDYAHCKTAWDDIVGNKRSVYYKRMRYRHPRGELISADIEVSAIRDSTGHPELMSIQMLHSGYRSTIDAMLNLLANRPDGDTVARAIRFGLLGEFQPRTVYIQQLDHGEQVLHTAGESGVSLLKQSFLDGIPLNAHLPSTHAIRGHSDVVVTYEELFEDYPLTRALFSSPGIMKENNRVLTASCIESQGIVIGVLVCIFPPDSWQFQRLQRTLALASVTAAAFLVANSKVPEGRTISIQNGFTARISDRQQTILRLIYDGHSNREIAEALSFSTATIKTDVRHMMGVLGVKNRTELIDMARSAKLFI